MRLLTLFNFQTALYIFLHLISAITSEPEVENDVLVLTVATSQTDGYLRFLRSARVNDIPVKTLGAGLSWNGGSMKGLGGGQKINLLKEELKQYKDDKDKIVLFTDSYDVIYLGGINEILSRFFEIGGRVVFGAEPFCWPDKKLASKYPHNSRGKQYLNSGGIIGYADEMYQMLTYKDIEDDEDDQLFYTLVYLNETLRNNLQIKLDHKSQIFHNLNGAIDKLHKTLGTPPNAEHSANEEEVSLKMRNQEAYLENTVTKTTPLILHGNGPTGTKMELNNLGNYLAKSWSTGEGCLACRDDVISLTHLEFAKYPKVLVAIFISKATPFLEDFFLRVNQLKYPKEKLDLFIYNNIKYHESLVDEYVEKYGKNYRSLKRIKPFDEIVEQHAKSLAIEQFLSRRADYYMNLDSEAQLDNPFTLKLLIEQNRSVIAPMLARPYKAWSNFWGALTEDGFYSRSFDYMDIVNYEKRGLWNVPYISGCYLVNGSVIKNELTKPSYVQGSLDHDMAFCYHMRENGVFMYVSNRVDFGHLVNPDTFDVTKTNPDLYQVFDNKWDWEQRYLHENYSDNLNPESKPLQPCPDVYWFPVASPRFCKELIETMEAFGKWSDGSNKDNRLDGGYENVPTRDIHMKQVHMEQHWLHFLKEYSRPLQEKVFTGYYHNDERLDGGYEAVPTRDIHMNQVGLERHWLHFLEKYVGPLNYRVYTGYQDEPPRAIMNFVVRYRPDEQPSLRPHHDSSTYTINLALNTAKKDYEGGGCRFIRYNCSVTDTRLGWLLMHPGRLTHYHEGLPVTKGTRYIMISFVDP